jgi:hypothetical protein
MTTTHLVFFSVRPLLFKKIVAVNALVNNQRVYYEGCP